MKHYLMTGAGSGIGQAVADRLQAREATLHLLARTAESAERLAGRYPAARVIVADLAEPEALATALDRQLPQRLHALLHIAGVLEMGTLEELTPAAWQASIAVNLLAPAELTRLALPALRAGTGQVVFVNSTSGLDTRPGAAAYAAAKFGLRALADTLRAEEGGTGIRVTSVYPSRTATPMQQRLNRYEGRVYDPALWMDPATVAGIIVAALDLPDDAEATDITLAVARGRHDPASQAGFLGACTR